MIVKGFYVSVQSHNKSFCFKFIEMIKRLKGPIYDVMSYSLICGALCVVPASPVWKMYPLYDETKASVEDTGKKEYMTVKRARQKLSVSSMR